MFEARICAGVLALLLGLPGASSAPSPHSAPSLPTGDEPRSLPLDRPIEVVLTPGEIHRYRVILHGPRCLTVAAAQIEIDVKVALLDPRGEVLAEVDARSSGREMLLALTERDGPYEVRVTSASERVPAGRYSLLVGESPADAAHRTAFGRHVEGRALVAAGKERLRDARRMFESARGAWESLGEDAMAAYSLFEIARLSKLLLEPAAAKDAFGLAARRFEELVLTADRAAAQNGVGEALLVEGDFSAACAQWQATFAIEDALTPVDRAMLRYNHGSTIKELGEYQASIAAVERAIASFQQLGQTSQELHARSELGATYVMMNEPSKALEELNRGVALSRAAGRPDMEARFLQRLGIVYWDAGDDDTAAEHWKSSVALHHDAGNRIGEGAVLLQLGDYTARHGDPSEAIATYEKALEIMRASGSKLGEARALTRLGRIFMRRGEYARAVEIQEKALEIDRAQGARQSEVNALLNLARTRSVSGDRAEARRLLTMALERTRKTGAGFAETDILGELALLDHAEGRTTSALQKIDAALAQFEAQQRSALVPSLKATLNAEAQVWYAAHTGILMDRHLTNPGKGWDAKALESAERARARALLSLLAESRADIRKGVDPALLERFRALQVQLSAADQGRAAAQDAPSKVAGRTSSSPARSGDVRTAEVEREINDLTRRIQLVESEIRSASPAYAALMQPRPLGVEEIRSQVLDGETVLLEFSLGEKRSWLWAVTKDALVSAPLAPAAEIESAAQRLHKRLSSRPAAPASEAASEVDRDAEALGRLLLEPIASRLSGAWRGRRLAIVSAGALAYVPFGVLPAGPPRNGDGARDGAGPSGAGLRGRRLIDDHEIVQLPSASVLALIRREAAGRPPAPLRLALIGDPVFGADDPRVLAGSKRAGSARARAIPGVSDGSAPSLPAHGASGTVASFDRGAGVDPVAPDPAPRTALVAGGSRGFPRLPFSRDEVRSIAALLPATDVIQATDFRASRALALDGSLARCRIVHIASHGVLNTAHPELSGIVLSLVDEQGRPQDGFLRLQDIYNLRLSADLVVLSACGTALGRPIAGEGLVGLSRGFMYAGAPRVVASLWQVDDSATAELMTELYRGLFEDRLPPAAALRAAQRKLSRNPRWAAPFYWAGFTIEGEWR